VNRQKLIMGIVLLLLLLILPSASCSKGGVTGLADDYETELHDVQTAVMAMLSEAASGELDAVVVHNANMSTVTATKTVPGDLVLSDYMAGLNPDGTVKSGYLYSFNLDGTVTRSIEDERDSSQNSEGTSSVIASEVSSAPSIQWVKTTDEFGRGRDVQQTTDGGYIVVGTTSGNHDVWLIKTDADGNEIWSRTFSSSGSEYGTSVCQTEDGGYIIAGEIGAPYEPVRGVPESTTEVTGTESQEKENGDSDIWLIKTDADGHETWSQRFGGEDEEGSRSVCQTGDNGYIIVGHVTIKYELEDISVEVSVNGTVEEIVKPPKIVKPGGAAIWLIRTDFNGNEIWNKTFSGKSYDYSSDVRQTTDGGYIITGRTDSFGAEHRNVWLIKTDADGNEIWNRTFGGDGWESGESVSQTADGGYIITGYTTSYGAGEEDVWLIKTDRKGNLIWSQTFGGRNDDVGKSVCQTASGSYIVVGYTYSFSDRGSDVWLIKTDANGKLIWSQNYDGGSGDIGSSVRQTADRGYMVTGVSSSRILLLKYQTDAAEVGIHFSKGLIGGIIGGIVGVVIVALAFVRWQNWRRRRV
jgi:hypothetical protein